MSAFSRKVEAGVRLASLALVVLIAAAAHADNHALIMGVSNYPQQPLPGVKRDMPNARWLAQLMNVPDSNIRVLTDVQLSLSGLRQALADTSTRVKPGDRIFIYFSGHGSSRAKDGRCEQGLVTYDLQTLSRQEFQDLIKPTLDRAAKSVVVLDTCFSGGVIERSRSGSVDGAPDARAKTLDPSGGAGGVDCEQPVNVASRALRDFDVEKAAVTPNHWRYSR